MTTANKLLATKAMNSTKVASTSKILAPGVA